MFIAIHFPLLVSILATSATIQHPLLPSASSPPLAVGEFGDVFVLVKEDNAKGGE
jgi:hypothetical protein